MVHDFPPNRTKKGVKKGVKRAKWHVKMLESLSCDAWLSKQRTLDCSTIGCLIAQPSTLWLLYHSSEKAFWRVFENEDNT